MYSDAKEKLAVQLLQLYVDWEQVENRIRAYETKGDADKKRKIDGMLQECQKNKQAIRKLLHTLLKPQENNGMNGCPMERKNDGLHTYE